MATEYVPLEAVKAVVCETCEKPSCPELWGGDCSLMGLLNDLPAADVRPVVRGTWLEPDDDYGYLVCSMCEERSPNDERWHFCPNCGADMRPEEALNE